MSLKAKIKAGAESLGFVSVGFTSVEPVPELQHYRNWIRNGQYAGMDYLASTRALETRSDPKKLLPSCKTVISLLSAYPPPSTLSMPEVAFGAAGKIAAYALLGDYHDVLRERLESLADLIGQTALWKPIRVWTALPSSKKTMRKKQGWVGSGGIHSFFILIMAHGCFFLNYWLTWSWNPTHPLKGMAAGTASCASGLVLPRQLCLTGQSMPAAVSVT